jgi:hypothetical protein
MRVIFAFCLTLLLAACSVIGGGRQTASPTLVYEATETVIQLPAEWTATVVPSVVSSPSPQGATSTAPILSTPLPSDTVLPPTETRMSPTVQPTPKPTSTCTDRASFVADLSIPDGSRFHPGTQFVKTWRLRNQGTCTWDEGYSLAFSSGELMSSSFSIPFKESVPPGAEVDLSVELTAPRITGPYKGYWMLRNGYGGYFGIGPQSSRPFWVKIVSGAAPNPKCNVRSEEAEPPINASEVGAYAVDVAGRYAFVSNSDGVAVLDMTDVTVPLQVGLYPGRWGKVVDLVVRDDLAYVGAGILSMINISDPTAPTLLGEVFVGRQPQAFDVAGRYAYVLNFEEGLHIVDISDAAFPVEAGIYPLPGNALALAVDGAYAYVAIRERSGDRSTGTLKVLDLTDPTEPQEVGEWEAPGLGVEHIAITGDLLIVSVRVDAYVYDIMTLDISNPRTPLPLGPYDEVHIVWDIEVAGSCAFVIDQDRGLVVLLDVSDPKAPREIGQEVFPGFPQKLTVKGEFAYIADTRQGLLLWRLLPPSE